ncbi:MAG: GyrI-like domain-containing protein [Lachnospiraceae bacterium]|nr:GyrI-like domain-containing protein [Lachnospiraceae bacterium]
MNYTIRELEAFSVIGQEIELTNRKKENIKICVEFWREFNNNLKKAYLSQAGNWIKYAFMERREDKLFYYCAIPRKVVIPEGFISKEISSNKCLVVEHIGVMDRIYETYSKIYKEILPNAEYIPLQENFLHFERYDTRFHWNRDSSVIEIWIPIK